MWEAICDFVNAFAIECLVCVKLLVNVSSRSTCSVLKRFGQLLQAENRVLLGFFEVRLDFIPAFPTITLWRSSPSRTNFATTLYERSSRVGWALSTKPSSTAPVIS